MTSNPFATPVAKPTPQQGVALVVALLLIAYGFERIGFYGFRAHAVTALVDQLGSDDVFQAYGTLTGVTVYGSLLGGLVAIATGPRALVLAGTILAAVGMGLFVVDLHLAGAGLLTLGVVLYRVCIPAWVILGVRHLTFARRVGILLLMYTAMNVGSGLGPILGTALGGASTELPFVLTSAAMLIAFGGFLAAYLRQRQFDEAPRPAPRGLVAWLLALLLASLVAALASRQSMDVLRGADMQWGTAIGPVGGLVFALAVGVVATIGAANVARSYAVLAVLVLTPVGGLLAVAGGTFNSVVAAMVGAVTIALAETLCSAVALALIAGVRPRFVAAVVGGWITIRALTYQVGEAAGDLTLFALIAAIAASFLALAVALKFRRSIDEPPATPNAV